MTVISSNLPGTHLLQKLTLPSNMSLTQSYEEKRDLLTGMHYKRGNTGLVERSYSYDTLGRPLTRRTARNGQTVNDTFGYNNRSELTTATVNNGSYAYDYDNIGNRKTAQEAAEEITGYSANNLNQYTALSVDGEPNFQPEYDADGNQTRVKTSTGIWAVSYDTENRPTDFTSMAADNTITTVHCEYDSMGRRSTKMVMVNGNVTLQQRYIYRGYLQIASIDLTRSHHPALWYITWDPTQPIATRPLAIQKDATWYTYGWDLTKNICEVFGPAGYLRTAYTYTPYGQVTANGDVEQPIQWSSEYCDTELGLVYYNYRHYNPMDGRWNGRDQDKYVYGFMYYVYSKNSPVMLLDRNGLYTYVQFNSNMGHGWIRTGGIVVNYTVKTDNNNNTYYESSWLFEGVGFYPMDDSTTKRLEYVFGLPGKWNIENAKEYMYTVTNEVATEYDLDVYKPSYQIEVGGRLFFEAKLQYGKRGKCCKEATSEEIKECITSHPAFKEAPNYYLLTGNCRDRANSILKDCCMEINKASGRPARKGYVIRRYSGQTIKRYGDKSIISLTVDPNSMPLL